MMPKFTFLKEGVGSQAFGGIWPHVLPKYTSKYTWVAIHCCENACFYEYNNYALNVFESERPSRYAKYYIEKLSMQVGHIGKILNLMIKKCLSS